MAKMKHLPNTKQKGKYIGTHTVKQVTEIHIVISKGELGCKREKIPIHIVRPYNDRIKDQEEHLEKPKKYCMYSQIVCKDRG